MSIRLSDYPERYRAAIMAERRAAAAVDRAATRLVELVRPIWHWSDGMGGSIHNAINEAAAAAGLEVSYVSSWARDLRWKVLERDAYRCQRCGDWHDLEIDHIIPRSRGGLTVMENLQVLCGPCNRAKGAS